MQHDEMRRLAEVLTETLEDRPQQTEGIEAADHRDPQLQECPTGDVGPCRRVLPDEPDTLERRQQPVRGRWCHAQRHRSLRHANFLSVQKQEQQAKDIRSRADRVSGRARRHTGHRAIILLYYITFHITE